MKSELDIDYYGNIVARVLRDVQVMFAERYGFVEDVDEFYQDLFIRVMHMLKEKITLEAVEARAQKDFYGDKAEALLYMLLEQFAADSVIVDSEVVGSG